MTVTSDCLLIHIHIQQSIYRHIYTPHEQTNTKINNFHNDYLPCCNNLGRFPMMLSFVYDTIYAMDDAMPFFRYQRTNKKNVEKNKRKIIKRRWKKNSHTNQRSCIWCFPQTKEREIEKKWERERETKKKHLRIKRWKIEKNAVSRTATTAATAQKKSINV